ncbi:MAG TPA: hypothetical protein VJ792_06645 [Candidatus Nitrosotalea sp.]|nr:hypothetical protein [Candidatus Nitrosotalea sp.]
MPPQGITCASGLDLALQESTGEPVCLFPSSLQVLLSRGWALPVGNSTGTAPSFFQNGPKTTLAMFYITGSNHKNLELFEKYLRPGDYLFITTPLDEDNYTAQAVQDSTEAKSKVMQGVNVLSFAWYSKIEAIKLHVAALPKTVDGVIYDYEEGQMYSPEYTSNFTQALSIFDSAYQAAHKNGLKFMVTPIYGDAQNGTEFEHPWDWNAISKDADYLVIQFQSFFKMRNSSELETEMGTTVSEISQSTQTPTFVELSLTAIGGTGAQDLQSMHELEKSGVHNFLIFFEPWTTGDLEYILQNRD